LALRALIGFHSGFRNGSAISVKAAGPRIGFRHFVHFALVLAI
jgi:hypothetical protein